MSAFPFPSPACQACEHPLEADASHEDAWSCPGCGRWLDQIDPEWWMVSHPPHAEIELVRVSIRATCPGAG